MNIIIKISGKNYLKFMRIFKKTKKNDKINKTYILKLFFLKM